MEPEGSLLRLQLAATAPVLNHSIPLHAPISLPEDLI